MDTVKPKQSLGEQAARFSLYTPITVGLINCFTMGNRDQAGVATAILAINVCLILAGFGLGIYALLSMRRFGRQRILWRSIVGLTWNGLIIGILLTLVPLMLVGQMRNRVVGHWRLVSGPNVPAGQIEFTFGDDGTFRLERSMSDRTFPPLTGRWVINRSRVLGLVFEGDGNPTGFGTVKTVDDHQMILGTDKGNEVYTRLP
jgi:hypothetical protein